MRTEPSRDQYFAAAGGERTPAHSPVRPAQLRDKLSRTMAALVIRSLNVLLGIFFSFLGTLKITPAISRELHKDLRAEYAKFAKVLPGAKSLGYKVPSKYYRRGVGVLEILCGEAQS